MTKQVLYGAFLGLTWGASLRAWMTVLTLEFGSRPEFTWSGTFGAILLPAALVGALLGKAAHAAETSGNKWWRWATLSPLLLMVAPMLITENFITTLVTTGMGGGAIAVALIGLCGGYAFSEWGPRGLRWVAGFLAVSLTLASVYGFYFASGAVSATPTSSEVFGGLLYVLLLAGLVAGVSAPSRYASK